MWLEHFRDLPTPDCGSDCRDWVGTLSKSVQDGRMSAKQEQTECEWTHWTDCEFSETPVGRMMISDVSFRLILSSMKTLFMGLPNPVDFRSTLKCWFGQESAFQRLCLGS
jgi:hypothetical protein